MKMTEEKLSYLLFLESIQDEQYTITYMARKLGITKSTLSKVLSVFYQEGLLLEKGKPYLSDNGFKVLEQWKKEISKITDWLCTNGQLPHNVAKQEAITLAIHMSSEVKKEIISHYEVSHFFDMLQNVKLIYGDMLPAYLNDGEYPFAFTIYKDSLSKGLEISMANDAFIHPGILKIEKGQAYLVLHALEIQKESLMKRLVLKGSLEKLWYLKNSEFIEADVYQDEFRIPISYMSFQYNYSERLLQGHIKLKMMASVGILHMPESTAILSIYFK